MDIDTALANFLALYARTARTATGDLMVPSDIVEDLSEAADNILGWVTRGGFRPEGLSSRVIADVREVARLYPTDDRLRHNAIGCRESDHVIGGEYIDACRYCG